MDGAAGMVAVVRGLRDAGLAVTLYDNGKQFTLAPNTFAAQPTTSTAAPTTTHSPLVHMHQGLEQIPHMQNIPHAHDIPHLNHVPHVPVHNRVSQLRSISTDAGVDCMDNSYNSAVQAIDGRYASVYQTTVGKLKPTSPPVMLTEFPPQRPGPDVRGLDNFVVGGTGSGDTTYTPVRIPNHYRGGMSWADRGSVCSPRPSRHPDAFASSLRKYPRLASDRSSEIVERLITYTQAKNYGKSPPRYQNTQTRSAENADLEEGRSKCSAKYQNRDNDSSPQRLYDESPTRGRSKQRYDFDPPEYKNSAYSRNYDVRYIQDISRSNGRSPSGNSPQPSRQLSARERYDVTTDRQRSVLENQSPSMVNSAIQAATVMICREVATVSREQLHQRNVAVSPNFDPIQSEEGAVSITKSIQTASPLSLQTTLSCIEIPSNNFIPTVRRSRSYQQVSSAHFQNYFFDKLEGMLRVHELRHAKKTVAATADSKKGAKKNKKVPTWYKECDDSCRAFRRKISKDLVNNMKYFDTKNVNIFRAEVTSFMHCNDNVRNIVKFWLDTIPLKSHDFLGRLVKKDQILSYVVCRLKIIPSRIKLNKKRFRSEILDIVDDIPFDIGRGNKSIYLNKLVEDLINKLEATTIKSHNDKNLKRNYYYNDEFVVNTAANFKRVRISTEERVKTFVSRELVEAIEESRLDLEASKAKDIEAELVDIILEYLEDYYGGRDGDVAKDIVILLRDTGHIMINQAENFARAILQKVKNIFDTEGHSSYNNNTMGYNFNKKDQSQGPSSRVRDEMSETCAVELIDQICGSMSQTIDCDEESCSRIDSSNNTSNKNLELNSKNNLVNFKLGLEKTIDKWLDGIQSDVPEVRDTTFRQIIISDLAGDIIDRYKYIEINNAVKISERDQLEHLRYQIFKWINKLGCDNNTVALDRVPELLKVIQGVPVPLLTKRNKRRWEVHANTSPINANIEANRNNSDTFKIMNNIRNDAPVNTDVHTVKLDQEPSVKNSLLESRLNAKSQVKRRFNEPDWEARELPDPLFTYARINNYFSPLLMTLQQTVGRTSQEGKESQGNQTPPLTIEKLNKEYEDFVKQWVQTIPLPPETSPDLVEQIRLGLFHGVFKAIAKIKSSPATMTNAFYYEDVLDDEIEELFSYVPETEEFKTKKHLLKVRLIEKTSQINEMIKIAHAPEKYGQKLVDQVSVYVPRLECNTENENPIKIYEELKILFLTDEFILYVHYKEEDQVKANVFRQKLIKHVQEFVADLKQTYNKELKDINSEMYVNDILAAMQQVPLPSNETIKQEADEIILGMEVDKWFNDLPLTVNNDPGEQLKRRRLRDNLAKKLYEMDRNNISLVDESSDRALRHEVSMVLEKLPLEKDQSVNINFMVDELTNRIKNRQRRISGQGGRKSVMFDEPQNFSGILPGQQYLDQQYPTQQTCTPNYPPQQNSIQQYSQPNTTQQCSQNVAPQRQPSTQWLNLSPPGNLPPATSVIKDPTGRMWYSFDQKVPASRNIQSKMYQSLPMDSLVEPAGAVNVAGTGPSTADSILGPQVMQGLQPTMQMPRPSIPVAQGMGGPQGIMQAPQIMSQGQRMSMPMAGTQGAVPSQSPVAMQPAPRMSMAAQPLVAQAGPDQNAPAGDGSFHITDYLKDYESRVPPLPPTPQHIRNESIYGPPISSIIQDPSKFGADYPISSTINQSQQPGNTAPSAISPGGAQYDNIVGGGPWPSMQPASPTAQSETGQSLVQQLPRPSKAEPSQFFSMDETRATRQSLVQQQSRPSRAEPSQFFSMDETRAPTSTSANESGPNVYPQDISLQRQSLATSPRQSIAPQTTMRPSILPQNVSRQSTSLQPQPLLISPRQSILTQNTMMPSMLSENISVPRQSMIGASNVPRQSMASAPDQSIGPQNVSGRQPSIAAPAGQRELNVPQYMAQQNIAAAQDPTFTSLDDSRLPFDVWQSNYPVQQQIPSYVGPAEASIRGINQQSPQNEANASAWLPQYMQDYEAAHGPLAPPNTTLPPPEYAVFEKGRPASSSFSDPSRGMAGQPAGIQDNPRTSFIRQNGSVMPQKAFRQSQDLANGQPTVRRGSMVQNTLGMDATPYDTAGHRASQRISLTPTGVSPQYGARPSLALQNISEIKQPSLTTPRQSIVAPQPDYQSFSNENIGICNAQTQSPRVSISPGVVQVESADRPSMVRTSQVGGYSQPASEYQHAFGRPRPSQPAVSGMTSGAAGSTYGSGISPGGPEQQAPTFFKSTDQEGIMFFADQNKAGKTMGTSTDISPPIGFSTPDQVAGHGRDVGSSGRRSRDSQELGRPKRQSDSESGDDTERCRCLEKIKKRIKNKRICHKCNIFDCPFRYYPPPSYYY